MKVAINRKIVSGPWGGGNQILKMLVNYFNENNITVVNDLDSNPDAILMFDSRMNSGTFNWIDIKRHGKKVPVICRINDNGAHRKDTRDTDTMCMIKELSPKLIFISEWVKDYYSNLGVDTNNSIVIHNSADRSVFNSAKRVRCQNDPLKIVTHHWSNNLAKGYDIYEHVAEFCSKNKDFSFRFMGNAPKNRLLNCERIPAQEYLQIPKYLKDQDIYLSASLFESGGCHVVEGMACGLIPIVRKGGGGTEDYSMGFSMNFDNEKDLIPILTSIRNDYSQYCILKKNIDGYLYSENDMCKKYYDCLMGEHEH